jgi:hypothetical protein
MIYGTTLRLILVCILGSVCMKPGIFSQWTLWDYAGILYAGRFARSWQLFDTQQTTHVRLKCISQIKGKKTSQSLLKPTIHQSIFTCEKSPSGQTPVWHLSQTDCPLHGPADASSADAVQHR